MNYKHLAIEERCCLREYLHKRLQLSKDSETHRKERQYGISRTESESYTYVRHTHILSVYGTKETFVAKIILP